MGLAELQSSWRERTAAVLERYGVDAVYTSVNAAGPVKPTGTARVYASATPLAPAGSARGIKAGAVGPVRGGQTITLMVKMAVPGDVPAASGVTADKGVADLRPGDTLLVPAASIAGWVGGDGSGSKLFTVLGSVQRVHGAHWTAEARP